MSLDPKGQDELGRFINGMLDHFSNSSFANRRCIVIVTDQENGAVGMRGYSEDETLVNDLANALRGYVEAHGGEVILQHIDGLPPFDGAVN